jgi:hypothetical protein
MTNKTTAQIVNEQVGKEMKELEARLVAAGYGKETHKFDDEFDKACMRVAATVRIKELEAEISKLQQEQDKRQKETDNLILELRQQTERYLNANARAISAEMKLAELVHQGVLKFTASGYESTLSREHIDETVFMCKIRANQMAEAFHEFKYQNNNAFATPVQRENAETKYLTALKLFNDTFTAL